MKSILFSVLLYICLSANAQQPATLNLMPVPSKVQVKASVFRISSSFQIAVKGDPSDSALYHAVNRTYQYLNRITGLAFGQKYVQLNDTLKNAALQVSVTNKSIFSPGVDESYTLDVDPNHITINAPTTIGALRGLQTLQQLCDLDGQGYYLPSVSIDDKPRFQWRGLMIDVARHFISVDEMERNIDAMAAAKMNVLHWHLCDDEGFRVESKLFPLLQQKGSNGEYYTQSQLKEIVNYAQDLGIMVVPEFDMPGHSQSWFAGYPELASQPGPYRPGPRPQWMNEHPDPNRPTGGGAASVITNLEASTFDATNPKVYKFLDKFFDEMTRIFPSGYVHIGADENNGLAWKLNPKIVAWMKKHDIQTTDDLQLYFVGRVHDILEKHNRRLIGWEEIYNDKLPKDAIIHKWIPQAISKYVKSHGEPEDFASHGYETLISEGFYLDVFMPSDFHYTNPAFVMETSPKILGGEGAQWTEIADNQNISLRMWPRAGAIAERLWSPLSVNDVPDMYRRLAVFNEELDQLGLLHKFNYERALRRLVNDENVQYLKTLTDLLTPVTGYQKMGANMMKSKTQGFQTTPLTAISDIIFVDSETEQKFRALVKAFLENHDKGLEAKIREYLTLWQSNDIHLQPLFNGNQRLMEVQDHSKNLSSAASIGLEALNRLDNSTAGNDNWPSQKVDELNSYLKPHSETQLSVVTEIVSLVTGKLVVAPKGNAGI